MTEVMENAAAVAKKSSKGFRYISTPEVFMWTVISAGAAVVVGFAFYGLNALINKHSERKRQITLMEMELRERREKE